MDEAEERALFAVGYAKWSAKPQVVALRELMHEAYPDSTQLERDSLAMQFLQFEMMRFMLMDSDGPGEGKEPWQI